MKIFGVTIDKYTKQSVLKNCEGRLTSLDKSEPLFLITINPEILLEAKRNKHYKKILNSASFRVIDGFGIRLVAWLKNQSIGDRIAGANLAKFLIRKAQKFDLNTGIIYNKEGLSSVDEIKKSLSNFKKIVFLGIDKKTNKIAKTNKLKKCDLIFVATGHPNQERLIYNSLLNLPKLKIVMGIGGTLDFWTKKKTRAPETLQAIGLEWLWRLAIQPNRFPRTLRALFIFPFFALTERND